MYIYTRAHQDALGSHTFPDISNVFFNHLVICVMHIPVADKTDKPKTPVPTFKQGITLNSLDEVVNAGPDYSAIQRNLALDLVRVTEAAALASGRWFGKGDKNAADQVRSDDCKLSTVPASTQACRMCNQSSNTITSCILLSCSVQ